MNPKREFYNIDKDSIEMAFNFINEFNKILNTKEKLFKYIQENNPEYFCKKRIYRSESSSSGKPKRKKKVCLWTRVIYKKIFLLLKKITENIKRY